MSRNHLYPHLLPDDILVWEKFLPIYGRLFDHFDYDVRVGKGRPRPDLPTAALVRMATDLSKRRIDAVGHIGDLRLVIEITHTIGLKALGQIIAYPVLYRNSYPGQYALRQLLVAGVLQSDIIQVLESKHIPYWTPELGLHFMKLLTDLKPLK